VFPCIMFIFYVIIHLKLFGLAFFCSCPFVIQFKCDRLSICFIVFFVTQ
jgi:hypothetical protein